jgi:hypothetical protein
LAVQPFDSPLATTLAIFILRAVATVSILTITLIVLD